MLHAQQRLNLPQNSTLATDFSAFNYGGTSCGCTVQINLSFALKAGIRTLGLSAELNSILTTEPQGFRQILFIPNCSLVTGMIFAGALSAFPPHGAQELH